MTATFHHSNTKIALRFTLNGNVQGIGLRPAVARFANELDLNGSVCNTSQGVVVHVEGSPVFVESFRTNLRAQIPATAKVEFLGVEPVEPSGVCGFSILDPWNTASGDLANDRHQEMVLELLATRVPLDVAICDDCRREVHDTLNRRFGYAFTSCTNCGPRYSIIDTMPYERRFTGMNQFPLCDSCRFEYESSGDRRFHSQTNCCPACGPNLWLNDANGRCIDDANRAVQSAAKAIGEGQTLAVRGLGGYQLLVDATSQSAVERLRDRKRRRGKPLAVLVSDLAMAESIAWLDEIERQVLCDSSNPILIVKARPGSVIAPSVQGGLSSIGVMLPSTPLHSILANAARRPLVCTSGNLEGEPIVYRAEDAIKQLSEVADLFLEHDRPILKPIDDSVVRVISGRPVTIRLARGMAPLPLNIHCDVSTLAFGGHQKSAVALCNQKQSVLGPHVGDLDSAATRQRFSGNIAELRRLYRSTETCAVSDLHSEYFTSRLAEQSRANAIAVQHHHAHIAAGMLEHDWLDRQVLGVAFDGTGMGTDGTIWGGEFLLATATDFQRIGHVRPFCLPGGEQAIREPWRVATALVAAAMGRDIAATLHFQNNDACALFPVLDKRIFSPVTTSAGRLFDGIASLVLGIEIAQFEGQAAMMLESICDPSSQGAYAFELNHEKPMQLDWRPVLRAVLHDRNQGQDAGTIAMRFHRGLANAICDSCQRFRRLPVVLGGGVFQNKILVELIVERMTETGQSLGCPGIIPPNDGGLAAGQLAIAAAIQRQGTKACV
jgi:hydrogenase maturation protein HypF